MSKKTIYLDDAIDAIRALWDGAPTAQHVSAMFDCEDAIRALPSAQPEQIWILCDERMPEEHEWIGTKKFGTTMSDEVYVTFENSKGERFTKHLHFYNGELSSYDKIHMDAWFKDYKPIAWMPLPEPYKERREERTFMICYCPNHHMFFMMLIMDSVSIQRMCLT